MEYRYTDIKALIERFCSSQKSNLYFLRVTICVASYFSILKTLYSMIVSFGELDCGTILYDINRNKDSQ